MMRKFFTGLSVSALLIAASAAHADWHSGRVTALAVGYDGVTVTFKVEGWSRVNCTCYPTWPDRMCLDVARATYEFEKALVLAARTRGTTLLANINETTCKVLAMYEGG